ncbi:MAG TPA: hypothetical protein VGP93_17110 [Polyangiaceae bacterium]|jgi:hypothetical protein|nr:hypothetical protein [Polyangiaceae bacterium]
MPRLTTFQPLLSLVLALGLILFGCQNKSRISAEKARLQLSSLAKAAAEDAREVRTGLPLGAAQLASVFSTGKPPADDPKAAEEALERARNKVQDLRTAKSTFFAVVDASGLIIRNDQDQDLMAGKNLFGAFPELRAALGGKYVEARGSMPEASGVRGRADAQWVAAAPVSVEGQVKGLYVSGWSWTSYAYRLENAIRTQARNEAGETGKLPLVYAFVVVDGGVYGAPLTPEVSIQTLAQQKLLEKTQPGKPFSMELEITGRDFGLAAVRVPEFGPGVAIAVLRSET